MHAKETLENRSTASAQHYKVPDRESKDDGKRTETQGDAFGGRDASKDGGRTPSGADHLSGQDREDRESEHEV